MKIREYFPIVESLSTHNAEKWRKDLVAGITVAVMLVPQGMAYAMLAGMPPIYGLYSGLVPLFLYAILGTSRQMSIGPVAVSSLLVLAGVSQLAEPFSGRYIELVILAGLLVGIVQMLMSFMRMGFLVNFISHPVIIGFTSAAAIIIAISQLKDMMGIEMPRFSHSYESLQYAIQHIGETNIVSLVMCVSAIVFMVVLRKIKRAIPGALLAVIGAAALVYFIGEEKMGIDLVREVPKGLPAFHVPEVSWHNMMILLPTIFTVTIIEIVESISIAKVLQSKHGNYKVRPDQELLALGLSKIAGSFFKAIPTSGSFTRSAVNNEAGAQSGFASIFTAIFIGLTLMFLTPLFYFVPKCILAAIILLSVKSLFEMQQAIYLWKIHRSDFFMMIATFIITLAWGIEEGVFAGVLLSILAILYKSAKPHMAVLGKLPNTNTYRNVERYQSAEQAKGVLIMRFDDQLYFANASFFLDNIQKKIEEAGSPIELFILDASSMHRIDSTGIHALEDLAKYLKKNGITFYISGMVGPVRDRITKAGLMEFLGEENQYINIRRGVNDFHAKDDKAGRKWTPEVLQSNDRKADGIDGLH